MPLLFEPETQYRYSTYGWVLVSAAVEAAANQPFFTFMRTQVFTPLGMADTMPDAPTRSRSRIVRRSTSQIQRRQPVRLELARSADYSCFAGAGAFLSTPSDLVRFGMAMIDGKLLQRSTVRMLQTPQQLVSGEDTGYGLGWMLETLPLAGEPTLLANHASRSLLGASTSFMTFPERGIVVALTSNTSYADTRSIAWPLPRLREQRNVQRLGEVVLRGQKAT
jgi:CubicO group peptidase (beta-lactamase class C family)